MYFAASVQALVKLLSLMVTSALATLAMDLESDATRAIPPATLNVQETSATCVWLSVQLFPATHAALFDTAALQNVSACLMQSDRALHPSCFSILRALQFVVGQPTAGACKQALQQHGPAVGALQAVCALPGTGGVAQPTPFWRPVAQRSRCMEQEQ
eukprot:NODE_3309_length_914_cov_57.382465_g3288_i0.p1 GENE.NODE_3309_length_914_cov_57.382465_g3288_i0~~NODE_3309_length_914_cov_57.382465_g3288_i0.p1  ORF type:complete len:157 (-),score=25.84 NODE_3309_length_914_cov_57.382465_g3288_i0:44-514(-)